MAVIIVIALIILLIIGSIFLIKHCLFIKNIVDNFKHCNVIVFGKKGSGKDLVFQWVIYKRKKEHYYANLDYGYNGSNTLLKEVSVYPNTYDTIVSNEIIKTEHKFKEKSDIYISDIGIFLPSYMDSTLYKKFPSMPIFYALSRHLYANNVHCNTQNLERCWKALREQADFYVWARKTLRLFGYLIIKVNTYDKYESAKARLEPLKARFFNKYSKSEVDLYNAQNGDIRSGHIILKIKSIKYDTRAFENILLKGDRLY